MPHRCVAGGCFNTSKDEVSLHGWPSNPQVARQWTKAVRNTRSDFNPTASSQLCSGHFSDESFETQSVIAQSQRLKMKRSLKPDTVPTIFKRKQWPAAEKAKPTSRKTTKTHLRTTLRTGLLLGNLKSKTGALVGKDRL